MCGIFGSDWTTQQTKYFQTIGSRRSATRWAAQLAEQLIEIVFDMWNHQNEILHKQDNNITEQQHKELNRTIYQICKDLPNMRLLTATERKFFKFASEQKVQERNVH